LRCLLEDGIDTRTFVFAPLQFVHPGGDGVIGRGGDESTLLVKHQAGVGTAVDENGGDIADCLLDIPKVRAGVHQFGQSGQRCRRFVDRL
jgi:hypothetical protein